MRFVHSLLGFTPLLALQRARRDLGLVLTLLAVLGLSVFLAIALPRLVLGAVDAGAREAIADAGHGADMEIHTDVGEPRPGATLARPQTVLDLARSLPDRLPPELARVYSDPIVT